jgi:hypothetical protein
MFRDGPKPDLGPYDPRGQWTNPGSTIPGPLPSQPVDSWWLGDAMPLVWSVPAVSGQTAGVFQRALWSSPLFDLRPDLRASHGGNSPAIPIWRTGYGAGGRLWVQMTGLNAVAGGIGATENLAVRYQEFGHIFNPTQIQNIGPFVDVTESVSTGGESSSTTLSFFPTGDGYPIRFWRVTITFDKTADVPPPVFTVMGAYY